MHTYHFRLTTGDRNVGTVYLPDPGSASLPVIIHCHGWGCDRQLGATSQALCDRAMRENMALVTFDFFGCGETGGDYSEMTYRRWKENLAAILAFIRAQPFADPDRIGCFAVSSGTTAALRLAMEDDGMAFLASVATCISTHIGMGDGGPVKQLTDNLSQLMNGEKVKVLGVDFPLDFYLDTLGNAPIHTMSSVRCPVLFLQGAADNTYRRADARMGYDLMRRAQLPAEYLEMEGGAHGLENMPDEAMDAFFGWLLPLLAAKSRVPTQPA